MGYIVQNVKRRVSIADCIPAVGYALGAKPRRIGAGAGHVLGHGLPRSRG